jgi:UDP-N-acetylglucosamine 2-epimerase (non-hydrolysing)
MESFLNSSIRVIEPAGYIDFLALLKNSYMVITDSGGIQDETTFLRIPCVTLRDNTERPVTINKGTNYLAGTDMKNAEPIIWGILNGKAKKGSIPELWDGRAAERIVDKIAEIL